MRKWGKQDEQEGYNLTETNNQKLMGSKELIITVTTNVWSLICVDGRFNGQNSGMVLILLDGEHITIIKPVKLLQCPIEFITPKCAY